MTASTTRLLPRFVRAIQGLAIAALIASPAMARPLMDSDLPPNLRDAALARAPKPAVIAAGAHASWSETGEASYYRSSRRFARTSSGERYDENAMTAAHPSLPLGTRLRVTRQDTGESIVVRINDRQGTHSRVIDLSYGAARRLGMLRAGAAGVVLTQVDTATPLSEPVEVAEAEDGIVAADFIPRHGRRHTRHGGRAASAGHRSSHARSVVLVRHSAPHRAAPRRL